MKHREKRNPADYPERGRRRRRGRQLGENPGRDSAVRGTSPDPSFFRGAGCKYEAEPNYGAVYGQLIVGFSTVRHGPRTCIRMQNRYSSCRPRLNIPIRAPSSAIATGSRFRRRVWGFFYLIRYRTVDVGEKIIIRTS